MINKFICIGRISSDIKSNDATSLIKYASFSVALTEKYTDKSGNKKENTEFVNISCFGTLSENVSRYLSKGSLIYVDGKIKTDTSEVGGVKKYYTKIIANEIKFLDKIGDKKEAQSTKQVSITTDDIPF